MAQEQKKGLDPIGVKKRQEDYEQMMQYYTLMKMKNKVKDFEAKSKEWWEVVDEYFTKEMEKNLAQHKTNEKILKYKLEYYQKNFPIFIFGSSTSIEVLGQDEENEIGPSGTTQEEEMQIKEPQNLKNGTIQEEGVQLEKQQDFK